MMKKIYLSIDWNSRNICVTNKKSFEEWREYLKGENNCGVYENEESLEIYDESNEDESDSIVELKVDEKDIVK
jgi:predicted secreted protein